MTKAEGHSLHYRRFIHDPVTRNYALTALLPLEGATLFIAAPLAGMGIQFPLFIGGTLGLSVAFAIVMISSSVSGRTFALLAAGVAIGGATIRIRHPSIQSIWLGHGAAMFAVFAVSLVIGQAVFAPGRVTHHRIEGAVILYLNIAVIFTSAYRLIFELEPAAFSNFPAGQTEAAAISGMLYFSFTTLTSTGFGEILPVHPVARSLTNLESVLGQLYLTILLARLVTMHVESRRD